MSKCVNILSYHVITAFTPFLINLTIEKFLIFQITHEPHEEKTDVYIYILMILFHYIIVGNV